MPNIPNYDTQAEKYRARIKEILDEIHQVVDTVPFDEAKAEQLQVILASRLIVFGFYQRSDENATAQEEVQDATQHNG